jgi:hypothetical protein
MNQALYAHMNNKRKMKKKSLLFLLLLTHAILESLEPEICDISKHLVIFLSIVTCMRNSKQVKDVNLPFKLMICSGR